MYRSHRPGTVDRLWTTPRHLRPTGTSPPVRPDYGGPCLDAFAPALMAPPGSARPWLPAPARDAAQVVLLVLDGLGWEQLMARLAIAPAMADMDGRAITSVVPTTTATALTSIALGRPPAGHGSSATGCASQDPSGDEVLNVLRWRTVSGDARRFLPPLAFQPGRRSPVGGCRS